MSLDPASVVQIVLFVLSVYAAAGMLFGVFFVWRGVGVIDHAARSTPLAVRAVFYPGAVALWPLLAMKWKRAAGEHA